MMIRSVELHAYGPFTNKTFEFRRGLNLVYGPNETGKTTLLEAVRVALFGCDDPQRLPSWGLDGPCRITLLLEGEGSNIRLLRAVDDNRVSFLRTDDMYRTLCRFEGDPVAQGTDGRSFSEEVAGIFGLADGRVFEEVLTFQQNRGELHQQGKLHPETLSLFKPEVGEARAKAIASVTEQYLHLSRTNPWGEGAKQDGELDRLQTRLKDLEENWHLRQETLKDLSAKRREQVALRTEIGYDEEELAKGERFLKRLQAARDAEQEENPLERELAEVNAELKKISHLIQRREELTAEREALGLGESPDYEIPSLAAEAEGARQDLHRLQSQSAALREELLGVSGPSWLFPFGATILFLTLSGLLTYWHEELILYSFFGGALLSAFSWIVHFWLLGGKKSEIGAMKERMLAIEEEREKAQLRLGEIDERLQKEGLPVSAKELQALHRQYTRHRDIEGELREIDSALGVLEDGEIMEQRRRELAEKIASEGGIVALDGGAEPLGPQEVAEAELRLDAFKEKLQAKRDHLAALVREQARLLEEVKDLAAIEREGDRLKAREKELLDRIQVLSSAREMLTAIDDGDSGANLEKLLKAVGRHLRKLTAGRHRAVRLGARGEISLQGRGGHWAALRQFGRATIDAVGLAFRLGMIESLFRGRTVPLLLDEPLINLDQQRMDHTLNQLEKFAAEHQVILFSHHEALLKKAAKAGWNMITLNGKEKRAATDSERRTDDEQQLHLL